MESSIQIEERAAAWLARRDSGSWTQADEFAFNTWLEESTANKVAFLRLEAAWEAADRLQVLGAGPHPQEWQSSPCFDSGEKPPAGFEPITDPVGDELLERSEPTVPASANRLLGQQIPPRQHHLKPIHHPWRAMAASVLVVLSVGIGWYLWPSGSSYRTQIGGIASVPMSDGSQVTLNTASEIRLAVTDSERRVDLEQGEAFFEVAKDPKRPFIVKAGGERFIAVGTKFSVRRDQGVNRLVVTEGRVRVETKSPLLAAPAPPTEVSAGGVARSGESGVLVEERPIAEAERLLSWRSGYLFFRETPLADAVAEFNRYNTKKIVIEDASVAGIRIGGNFRSTNVDAFVRLLEDGFPMRVERRDERIILSQN